MTQDFNSSEYSQTVLRVDGGMSASDWTMQFLSDILNSNVDRPKILETTALGAAYLAGLFMDFYPKPPEFSKIWMLDRRFEPEISATQREKKYAGWLACVDQVLKVKS